jgi:hypothetical protein
MEGTASANAKARTKLKVRIDISPGRTSRRLVGQFDNQGLFPDICTESGKWFRGGGELFRRYIRNETLGQKVPRFQYRHCCISVVCQWRSNARSLAEARLNLFGGRP